MLTNDPPAKLPAPTKEASDGWRLKIALVACLYIRIIISQLPLAFLVLCEGFKVVSFSKNQD